MRFSQRIGKRPIKTVLQVESIDDDLRVRLWNVIVDDFKDNLHSNSQIGVAKQLWKDFFAFPMNEIPMFSNVYRINYITVFSYLGDWFRKAEWYEIYDLIEYLTILDEDLNTDFAENCNAVLAREVSGYRLIDKQIVQITSEEEIAEIEEAIGVTDSLTSVNQHLSRSIALISDRKSPDYRNSIKESISAVESFCKIVTGDENSTLGKALAVIERNYDLHRSLKTAFTAIYGYTSDAGGIRHAMLEDEVEIKFEDAKFMLVSCSAFINYLRAKLDL